MKIPRLAPLEPRDPHETHRAATPLELFFDLVFVVAIAQAAAGLHHAIAEQHAVEGLFKYMLVFFAIWWAWMNFTWFASAYDNDGVTYRVLVFLQLVGALILAAGVTSMFENLDFRLGIAGYVVMRLALVTQWLRVARSDPPRRKTALRYAGGITVLQIFWVLSGFLQAPMWVTLLLIAGELLVPVWAEKAGFTPWHKHHIIERYGLLNIIVLGEAILAASIAFQAMVASDGLSYPLVSIIIGGILIVCSLWWSYFDYPLEHLFTSMRTGWIFGYGHYVIYAAGGAVGAGLAVAVDHATGHGHASDFAVNAAVAIPVCIFLLTLWVMHLPNPNRRPTHVIVPIFAVLIVLTSWTGQAALLSGLLLVLLNAIFVILRHRLEKMEASTA